MSDVNRLSPDWMDQFAARYLPNGPDNRLASPTGQSVGPATPIDPIVGRDQFTGQLQTASEAAAQARRQDAATMLAMGFVGGSDVVPPGGIRAFHGSPHSFDAFDASKIGTGEGAQAYGHGLYFAGNEGVAQGYKSRLSGPGVDILRDGKPVGTLPNMHVVNDPKFVDAYNALIPADTQGWIKSGVLRDIRDTVPDVGSADLSAARQTTIARMSKEMATFSPAMQERALADVNKAYDSIGNDVSFRAPGHMYEVNLNTAPNRLLDWDKPLSEQPQAVRDALASYNLPPAATGRDALDAIAENLAPQTDSFAKLFGHTSDAGRVAASDTLQKAGIDGIQYLDAGSRAAGDGSRNYVMFDPAKVAILRKYGLLGTLGATGASPFFPQSPDPQAQ